MDPFYNFEMAFPYQGYTDGKIVQNLQIHMLVVTCNGVPLGEYKKGDKIINPASGINGEEYPQIGIAIKQFVANKDMETMTFEELLENIPAYEDAYDIADDDRFKHFTEDNIVNHIIRSASYIARKTRRGCGTRYFMLDDGLVVFYVGTGAVDTPITRTDYGNVLNPLYKDYFVRIKCDPKLVTQKTIDILDRNQLFKADRFNRNYADAAYLASRQVDPFNPIVEISHDE